MKPGIHPPYVEAQVVCACGNTFVTRSTRPLIRLEICSACHPFFTGRQKLLDTAGRIDRFQRRFAKTEGQMIHRKPSAAKIKKLAPQLPKKKVLTSAPKKSETKADKKSSKKP